MHGEFEIEVTLECWRFSVTNVVLIRSVDILQFKFCMHAAKYFVIKLLITFL